MSQRSALFMENTEIAPSKSAAEITSLLVRSGARRIEMEYGDGGKIIGLRFDFQMPATGKLYRYGMPVRTETIYKQLAGRQRGYVDRAKLQAKAERIAWRQLFRWTQVQMAMIDMGMARPTEIFMPYALNAAGQTLYQVYEAQELKMLEAPK